MDEATSNAWNKWFDQRLNTALEAERAHFERRLNETEVEILTVVTDAFKTNVNTTSQYIEDAVEKGIRQSLEHTKKLLTEFHGTVRDVLAGREPVPGPRETLN